MIDDIRFTPHARAKFELLARYGFVVTEAEVIETLRFADKDMEHGEERIAQKTISSRHVLRVVYRSEGTESVVITFYPGRRGRYEDDV